MSRQVSRTVGDVEIQGLCDPDWTVVLDAFADNFAERDELGASFCVTLEGETKIDVWGGWSDEARTKSWNRDTVSIVFSATKGATALCANMLIDEGKLDLHAPVSRYWPEFAKKGKESATVAMILNHSVGVPGFREPLKDGAFADWEYMIHRLEEEPAFWEPGVRCGYHLLNIGWLAGELVRRVSGKSLGAFFKERVADKLGIDFWIGLPEDMESRVSHIVPYKPVHGQEIITDFHYGLLNDPESDASKALLNTGNYSPDVFVEAEGRYAPDTRRAHAAEIGGAGGITNARGLAGLYRPLANGGEGLISADHIIRMSQVSMCATIDPILLMPTRFALGFMKSMDNRHRRLGDIESVIIGDPAFGHVGAGGSLGFADPQCHLSFGYTMNRMGPGILLVDRGQALVDAVYRRLGYRTNAPGVWVR
jgi:CubicO group peptidase (beta-lactamase class C family)